MNVTGVIITPSFFKIKMRETTYCPRFKTGRIGRPIYYKTVFKGYRRLSRSIFDNQNVTP